MNNTNWNVNKNNVCIDGHDCVCYCKGTPQKGVNTICCTHDGCTFWFCNEQNKSTFESNPQQYAPQYGGFCAWGISQGKCCTIDPNCFVVTNGKLYLFENTNVMTQWQSNVNTCCPKADANWSKGQLAAA